MTELWLLSLVAECGALTGFLRRSWRRAYPGFFAYLILDVLASAVLWYVARLSGAHYDAMWQGTQLLLCALRFLVVSEAVSRLTACVRPWLIPVSAIWGLGAAMTAVFSALLHRPLAWPHSTLEIVFAVNHTSAALFAFVLFAVLSIAPQRGCCRGAAYWHAVILSGYMALLAVVYAGAAVYPVGAGKAALLVAAIAYAAWMVGTWKVTPEER